MFEARGDECGDVAGACLQVAWGRALSDYQTHVDATHQESSIKPMSGTDGVRYLIYEKHRGHKGRFYGVVWERVAIWRGTYMQHRMEIICFAFSNMFSRRSSQVFGGSSCSGCND